MHRCSELDVRGYSMLKVVFGVFAKIFLVVIMSCVGLYIGKSLDSQQSIRPQDNRQTVSTAQLASRQYMSIGTMLNSELVELYTADRKALRRLGLSDASCDILLPSIIYRPVDLEKLGLRSEQKAIALRRLRW